jgi:hypothetical protein
VAVLAVIIGVVIFTSNRGQKDRASAISLSLAVFGAALWVFFVQLFRNATTISQANIFLQIFSAVALLIPIGCLLYASSLWLRKGSLAVVSSVAGLIWATIMYFIIFNFDMFQADIAISTGNNYGTLADSPVTVAYFSAFGVFFVISIVMIVVKAFKNQDANFRRGLLYLAGCLALSSLLSSTTNIILPIIGHSELFWVGPLSVALTMIFAYFIILRYKLFVNSSHLLQTLTYLVVVAIVAIIYTCLFYLIFTLVFRGASPSDEIVIFNFVMIVIVILILPSVNHSIKYVRKVIADNGVSLEEQNETK